jgi:hypothetical protein
LLEITCHNHQLSVFLLEIGSELLSFWTLSIVPYSKNYKAQRFLNWIYFRPQVEGETPIQVNFISISVLVTRVCTLYHNFAAHSLVISLRHILLSSVFVAAVSMEWLHCKLQTRFLVRGRLRKKNKVIVRRRKKSKMKSGQGSQREADTQTNWSTDCRSQDKLELELEHWLSSERG